MPRFPAIRVTGCKEPSLILGFGQHDADCTIRPSGLGALQQPGAKLRGAVVIGVQQDQNAPIRTRLTGCELHGPLQFAVFQELLAPDSDRPRGIHHEVRRHKLGNPPKQYRNGLHLTVAFDNGYDSAHGSDHAVKQSEVPWFQI